MRRRVMTEDQWGLVVRLFKGDLLPKDFLRLFGAESDGPALSLELVLEGLTKEDDRAIETGLVIGFHFGFLPAHASPLIELAVATWHHAHENVVLALLELKDPSSVPALEHTARWVPDYLEFDEFRALAYKSIWALGAIQGTDADAALMRLATNENSIVAKNALVQVEWRSKTPPDRWPYMEMP